MGFVALVIYLSLCRDCSYTFVLKYSDCFTYSLTQYHVLFLILIGYLTFSFNVDVFVHSLHKQEKFLVPLKALLTVEVLATHMLLSYFTLYLLI